MKEMPSSPAVVGSVESQKRTAAVIVGSGQELSYVLMVHRHRNLIDRGCSWKHVYVGQNAWCRTASLRRQLQWQKSIGFRQLDSASADCPRHKYAATPAT